MPTRWPSDQNRAMLVALQKMSPGEWFFIAGGTQSTMQAIRRHARRAGLRITVHINACDPKFQKQGARVYLKEKTE